ncbi:MAG: hypothetical protein JWP89_6963 [Schlesneria sp.]|nr:hypothetical protein [Schlesneria sp.]
MSLSRATLHNALNECVVGSVTTSAFQAPPNTLCVLQAHITFTFYSLFRTIGAMPDELRLAFQVRGGDDNP